MILYGSPQGCGQSLGRVWGVIIEVWRSERPWGAPLELLIAWHAVHLSTVQVCRVWRS